MSLIEWTSSYSVGLPDFDKHHRHLFDLLNKIYDSCTLNEKKETFFEIVEELNKYTNYHFTAEEKLMGSSFYPGLSGHKNEHAVFISKISELRSMESSLNHIELVELTQFLIEWFSHHILEVDKKYSQLLVGGM